MRQRHAGSHSGGPPTGFSICSIRESVLEDEVILPIQLQTLPKWTPIQQLHAALLMSALEDYRAGLAHCQNDFRVREVELWIGGAPALVTFQTVCSSLGYDVGTVRAAILHGRMKRTRLYPGKLRHCAPPRPSRARLTFNTAF